MVTDSTPQPGPTAPGEPDEVRERAAALAERYGTHRPGARVATLVVTVLLAGAGLGWLAWAAWFHSTDPVQAEVIGFDVVDTHRVDADVDVGLRRSDATGSCLLRASAADHTIVGERSVTVDAGSAGRRTYPVRTEREATTVEVVSCTADRNG